MGFDCFAQEKVDIAVIEVGLGGRLDSTNIIEPEVAVITQIDFDHESFLGHSIGQIAAEKAGIIKHGAWVVSAAGNRSAREVIVQRAAEQNARLVEVDAAYRVANLQADDACYRFTLTRVAAMSGEGDAQRQQRRSAANEPPGGAMAVSLPIAGRYQVRNAVTAVAAAHLLAERGCAIDDAAITQGLAEVRWPGRLERVQQHPAVYLDGTHNPAGARELVSFWNEHLCGRRIHLIYGAMRDKAVDEVAGILFPCVADVILTQSPQARAISAQVLADMTRHFAKSVEIISDPAAAFERALATAHPEDVVFVTGSLFLVGDLQRYLDQRKLASLGASE
jgi:dihydrofolate synthase/folylpolyglutamate synthase